MTGHSADQAVSTLFEGYLEPTWYIDSDNESVIAHAHDVVEGIDPDDPIAQSIALFNDVRDGIPYNPYGFNMQRESLRASSVLVSKGTFCIPKAVLLAALTRVLGIPSRLGFADVMNHLATDRVIELMKTDVFAFHGYTELYLEGRWVKATSAFDRVLCKRFNVPPLEFDGRHDAMLQSFNAKGEEYMEYINDHGSFADMPFDLMIAVFRKHYPHWFPTRSTG